MEDEMTKNNEKLYGTNLADVAVEIAEQLRQYSNLKINTFYDPEELVAEIKKHYQDGLAWETAEKTKEGSILLIKKKGPCCGACH